MYGNNVFTESWVIANKTEGHNYLNNIKGIKEYDNY